MSDPDDIPNEFEAIATSLNQSLPTAEDAEVGLLEIVALHPQRLQQARSRITPEAFYHHPRRMMYELLLEMADAEETADTVTVFAKLRSRGTLEKVSQSLVVDIMTSYPIEKQFPVYLEMVTTAWTLRKAVTGHARAMLAIFRHGMIGGGKQSDARAVLAQAQEIVTSSIEGNQATDDRTRSMDDCVLEHLDYMESLGNGSMILFPIGIPSFDKRARGVACDEYCLITGPTKSGKTTLAQKIFKLASIAAKENPNLGKGAYYSGEVSPRTIGGRAIFNTGYVSAAIERTGLALREDQEQYLHATARVQREMGDTATVINACGMAIEEVLADMRQKWETGHRLFVIDYIGKFYSSRTFNNREREIAYMSGRLFDFSKRPGKPAAVICLAQLNDDGQVRDCRGLEHDCDMHLKIARVFKQEKGKEPVEMPSQRSLIVERGRSIEAGYVIPIYFEGCHYKFEEATPQ